MCAGTFPGLNFFLNIFYNPVSPVYYINPGLLRLWLAPYCGVLVSSRNRKEMAGKTEPMENTRVPRNDWFGRARRRDSSARQDPLSSIKRWDQRTTNQDLHPDRRSSHVSLLLTFRKSGKLKKSIEMASVGVCRLIGITALLVTFVAANFYLHEWLEDDERNQKEVGKQGTNSVDEKLSPWRNIPHESY